MIEGEDESVQLENVKFEDQQPSDDNQFTGRNRRQKLMSDVEDKRDKFNNDTSHKVHK